MVTYSCELCLQVANPRGPHSRSPFVICDAPSSHVPDRTRNPEMHREDQPELQPIDDHPLDPTSVHIKLRTVSAIERMQNVDTLGAD